uniref:APO domain-containing protein n=1 Tax=Salix viminalis TaxID=40686 RepID=A0A6N2LLD2_SALVM
MHKILKPQHLLSKRPNLTHFFSTKTPIPLPYGTETNDPSFKDIPKPVRDKSERNPYVTPMKVLIKRAKEEREARKLQPCRMLENPPENGLLVPQLVPVAHQVYEAREALISGISKLVKVIPVQKCRIIIRVTGQPNNTTLGMERGILFHSRFLSSAMSYILATWVMKFEPALVLEVE